VKIHHKKHKITESTKVITLISLCAFCIFVFFVVNPATFAQEERINVNTASLEEFMRLPGIGPALAARLVEYRRKHGRFKRPQEIIIVRGMSASLYRRIAHLIRI